LLIEEQRTNLLLQSQGFDTASWGKTASSVTANTSVAPDGTTTAETLVATATTGYHLIGQSVTTAASTTYAFSVFVKAAAYTKVILSDGNGGRAAAAFDLTAASVLSTYGSGYSASSISNVGNGWYRCVLIFTTGAGTPSLSLIGYPNSGATLDGYGAQYTGDGASGVFAWGAQLEAGAFATSYIPTVASQVTRAADSASMIGNNFARWYNQSAGSLFAEYSFIGTIGATRAVVALANPATGNYADAMTMGGQSTANALVYFEVRANSTDQANILLSTATVNTPYKSVASFALNNVTATNNGVVSGSDTSAVLPFVTTLWIGRRTDGGTGSTTIKRIAYYGRILSTSEQQGITS
jgi:hypothetical protein